MLYPFLRVAVRVATEHFKTSDSDLVLVIVITFLCAAATERIGVHPVFGAFVAGIVLHQTPRLRKETVAKLESVTFGVLAPIFFGIVGLRVNLWALGGGHMLGIVIAVACVGKLVGCSLGAIWGGLRFWEAASIAVAMNARGAMEIVVATIGLSLGILTPQMFSIIVMVAIVTSFLAPVGPAPDDAARAHDRGRGAADPGVGIDGGLRSDAGAGAARDRRRRERARGGAARLRPGAQEQRARSRSSTSRRGVPGGGGCFTAGPRRAAPTEQIEQMRALARGRAPEIAQVSGVSIAGAICEEARRGCDVIVLGLGRRAVDRRAGRGAGGRRRAPCHVAIMKAPVRAADYQRILVPVDGSVASRLAVELALRYAEATEAELALAVLTERRPQAAAYADLSGTHVPVGGARDQRRGAAADLDRVPRLGHQAEHPPPGVRSAFQRDRRRRSSADTTISWSSAPRTAPSSTGCSSATRTSA